MERVVEALRNAPVFSSNERVRVRVSLGKLEYYKTIERLGKFQDWDQAENDVHRATYRWGGGAKTPVFGRSRRTVTNARVRCVGSAILSVDHTFVNEVSVEHVRELPLHNPDFFVKQLDGWDEVSETVFTYQDFDYICRHEKPGGLFEVIVQERFPSKRKRWPTVLADSFFLKLKALFPGLELPKK